MKHQLTNITKYYDEAMRELVSTLSTLIIFFHIVQKEMGVNFKTDIEKCEKLRDKYRSRLHNRGVTFNDLNMTTSTRTDRKKRTTKKKMEEQHELFND